MGLNIRSLLNKTVLVSLPKLFGDTEARPCRVVATEPLGVWLISEDLSQRVLPKAERDKGEAAQAIFVPFAQIGAIVPLAPALSATAGLKPASAAAAAGTAAAKPAKAATGRAGNAQTNATAQTNPSNTSGSAGA